MVAGLGRGREGGNIRCGRGQEVHGGLGPKWRNTWLRTRRVREELLS